jgi:hypothetical protein
MCRYLRTLVHIVALLYGVEQQLTRPARLRVVTIIEKEF